MAISDQNPGLFKVAEAAKVIQDTEAHDAKAIVYYPSFLCHVTFPASRVLGSEYERRTGPHLLSVLCPSSIGIPFGIFPRLMIGWITSEIKRKHLQGQDTSRLFLGETCAKFLQNVTGTHLLTGGKTGNITRFRNAYLSLVASTIHYSYNLNQEQPGEVVGPYNFQIAENVLWHPQPPQPRLVGSPIPFNSEIVLGRLFEKDIINRGVPLDERILRALHPKCLATDIYTWATYRANAKPSGSDPESGPKLIPIRWEGLRLQFGAAYDPTKPIRAFKVKFLQAASDVHKVYPDFSFEDRGSSVLFTLHDPSVGKRTRSLPGLPAPEITP